MPVKIITTPNDPVNFKQVVYVPERQRDLNRPNPPRPPGRALPGSILQPVAKRQFVLGLDLGQADDYSTLISVEPTSAGYEVGMIARTRGKPYPELVAPIVALMVKAPFADASTLVVDRTGLGAPVFDLLCDAGLAPVGITITGGARVTGRPRLLGVPKRDLVNGLLVIFQGGLIKIASELQHAGTLARELQAMRRHVTAAGNDTYGAAAGEHDDLVLALAMAVWFAEHRLRRPVMVKPAPSAEGQEGKQRRVAPRTERLTPESALKRIDDRRSQILNKGRPLVDDQDHGISSIDKL